MKDLKWKISNDERSTLKDEVNILEANKYYLVSVTILYFIKLYHKAYQVIVYHKYHGPVQK